MEQLKQTSGWRLHIMVFVITVIFLSIFQLQPNIGDPDGFYHVKIAQEMRTELIIDNFPYLQFSTLKNIFIDHHFVYHLLLIPFVTFFPTLWGAKVITILLGAGFVTAMFWFAKKQNWYYSWLAPLLLLVTAPFLFRLTLIKATPLALLLIVLLIYFLFNKSRLGVLIISWLFVYTYAAWPIAFLICLVYFGLNIIYKEKLKPTITLLLANVGGLIGGLILNPYFPKNILFYWQQIVEISVMNLNKTINVGTEWLPQSLFSIFQKSSILILFFALALILVVLFYKRVTQRTWFFLILTATFLALSIKSNRYMEYFVPFAVLFIMQAGELLPLSKEQIKSFFPMKSKVAIVATGIILSLFSVSIVYNCYLIYAGANQHSFTRLQTSSEFLARNTPENSIVFQTRWDEWPMLYFHNDNNNYFIGGLDPTFNFLYNKEKFLLWEEIILGEKSDNLGEAIKTNFDSRYILATKKYKEFISNLNNQEDIVIIYEDEEAIVFEITS